MDKVGGLLSKLGGDKNQSSGSGSEQKGNNSSSGGDYLDKALNAAEDKFGIDSNKMRSANEKITGAAREQIEKVTSKKSN